MHLAELARSHPGGHPVLQGASISEPKDFVCSLEYSICSINAQGKKKGRKKWKRQEREGTEIREGRVLPLDLNGNTSSEVLPGSNLLGQTWTSECLWGAGEHITPQTPASARRPTVNVPVQQVWVGSRSLLSQQDSRSWWMEATGDNTREPLHCSTNCELSANSNLAQTPNCFPRETVASRWAAPAAHVCASWGGLPAVFSNFLKEEWTRRLFIWPPRFVCPPPVSY